MGYKFLFYSASGRSFFFFFFWSRYDDFMYVVCVPVHIQWMLYDIRIMDGQMSKKNIRDEWNTLKAGKILFANP